MKNLSFFAFLLCFGSFALASAEEYVVDPSNCGCCQNAFEGGYIGGNIGVVSNSAHRNDLDGFLTDNSGWTTVGVGFTGGLQAGYDWQCCNALFGIVGDWNHSGASSYIRDNPNASVVHRVKSDYDWFSTIRARAGLAVCNALVYVTGGLAVGNFETTWKDTDVRFNYKNTRWGWTGGAGSEFLICGNWSVGAEFLFTHYPDKHKTFVDAGTRYAFGHSDSAWAGKIMVNYRFGDLCCLWR